jgi:hypothetical protein
MIRMNYIRYVKTQFHEMRLQEEADEADNDEDKILNFKFGLNNLSLGFTLQGKGY